MQQLIMSARNIRHIIQEQKDGRQVQESIEAILTVMDSEYKFVGTGLVSVENTETIRFLVTSDGARSLANQLAEWADEAESQRAEIAASMKIGEGQPS